MNNDDNWPSGVEIRGYFLPKRKVEVESAEMVPKLRVECDGRLLKSCEKAVAEVSQVEIESIEMQSEANIEVSL